MLRLEDQASQIDDAVPEKEVAAHPEIRRRDSHFDTHSGDDERLMIGEADTMEKEGIIKIAPLVRGINPAQQAEQDDH